MYYFWSKLIVFERSSHFVQNFSKFCSQVWGEYFSIFFSLLWTELALVLHIIKHFQLNLCLSQLQPDRFLCKARTKWRWVQRSTLAPHQVHIRHPKKIPPLIWHLIRALANGITLNMFILVPIFYWRIFKFRKTQDSIVGIPLESVIGGYNIHLQEWRKTILTR